MTTLTREDLITLCALCPSREEKVMVAVDVYNTHESVSEEALDFMIHSLGISLETLTDF